jgi:hypothetical protein
LVASCQHYSDGARRPCSKPVSRAPQMHEIFSFLRTCSASLDRIHTYCWCRSVDTSNFQTSPRPARHRSIVYILSIDTPVSCIRLFGHGDTLLMFHRVHLHRPQTHTSSMVVSNPIMLSFSMVSKCYWYILTPQETPKTITSYPTSHS